MFNLEQAIAEWRQQMLAAGIQTPVPLEELENHLREEVEQQTAMGLTPPAAFPIAVERVGQGNLLGAEFKKAGGVDRARLCQAANYFCALLLGVYVLVSLFAMSRNNLSRDEWWLGLAAQGSLLGLIYFVWTAGPRFFPLVRSGRVQSAFGLLGGISGAVWLMAFARLVLPRFDFNTGQLVVAVLWAMVPTILLPLTAFRMLDKSESQRRAAR